MLVLSNAQSFERGLPIYFRYVEEPYGLPIYFRYVEEPLSPQVVALINNDRS